MIVVSFVLGAVVALAVAGFVYALVETFFNIDRAVEKEHPPRVRECMTG